MNGQLTLGVEYKVATLPPKRSAELKVLADCGSAELAEHEGRKLLDRASFVKGDSSARSKGSGRSSRVGNSSSGTFLNHDLFTEALKGFNKYEPELWMPTISINITDFVRTPLQLVVGFTLAATALVKLVPPIAPLFSLSSDL